MIRVEIAHEVPEAAVSRVKVVLARFAERDVDFNGAEFELVRGDYTCLPDLDGDDACRLFNQVQAAIQG